jgi:hypothetical protein
MGAAGASGDKIYVEDVFSTWLYTGTEITRTITNGIDLSGKGGLVWIKDRSYVTGHRFTDTARGATKSLDSSSTAVEATESTGLTAFGSTGFTLGADIDYNNTAETYASWTFRKAPKFFDVVTYTGTSANRTIAHNLGSVPGCIIVKRTDFAVDWQVYHSSIANTEYLVLNSTAAKVTGTTRWNSTTPTSSVFSLGTDITVNASGGTYVAYLFAHDAGGFGDAGNQSVIKCGSYTGNGVTEGPFIDLGWEPQFLLLKAAGTTGDWVVVDNMRGLGANGGPYVYANTANSELATGDYWRATATGFQVRQGTIVNQNGVSHIYIAIRRGPMKTPTDATKVFGLSARTGTGASTTVSGSNLVTDAALIKNRGGSANLFSSRLTGTGYLQTSTQSTEAAAGTATLQTNPWDVMSGIKVGTASFITNDAGSIFINYLFSRAPGFFDVTTYTGTGVARTINHNLGVTPEMYIIKSRSGATTQWVVGGSMFSSVLSDYIFIGAGGLTTRANFWQAPTSTTIGIGSYAPTDASLNASGSSYIAYLFASCPGVSKVGTYTGTTGAAKQIDCGFTAGARFVMIRSYNILSGTTDQNWYIWDTARGVIAGNDPYWLLNSANAETTATDYIDPYSLGFELSASAPAGINASGETYFYLAIA